jgi:hypothetical protein
VQQLTGDQSRTRQNPSEKNNQNNRQVRPEGNCSFYLTSGAEKRIELSKIFFKKYRFSCQVSGFAIL